MFVAVETVILVGTHCLLCTVALVVQVCKDKLLSGLALPTGTTSPSSSQKEQPFFPLNRVNDWTADFPGKSAVPTKHVARQTKLFSSQ